MSDPGDFIDTALQQEAPWERAGGPGRDGLRSYGTSVGAIRGTVKNALRRYRALDHDDVLSLSSELWAVPVLERRHAAVVLLQSKVQLLLVTDLTRIEGFLRQSGKADLADPLALDVVGPLIDRLSPREADRAAVVLDRWASDESPWLSRAALLSPLRPLRAGGGDWDGFVRRARSASAIRRRTGGDDVVGQAVQQVTEEMARVRPELPHP